MAQGEKVFKSVQAQGLANARKQLQKDMWSFQTHGVKNPCTGVRKILPKCTRDKIPIPQREGFMQRALGRVGPASPG